MKTLQQSFNSLSHLLHDSCGNPIAEKHFYRRGSLLDQQLRQEGSRVIVSIPVPGFRKDDLLVHSDGKLLIISEKEPSQANKRNGAIRRDGLKYSFVLPQGIDSSSIKAKCRDGLLTITLDKAKRRRPLTIKVDGDDSTPANMNKTGSWLAGVKDRILSWKLGHSLQ
jgi:HSP20 family protein